VRIKNFGSFLSAGKKYAFRGALAGGFAGVSGVPGFLLFPPFLLLAPLFSTGRRNPTKFRDLCAGSEIKTTFPVGRSLGLSAGVSFPPTLFLLPFVEGLAAEGV
jgi:hypothetical protein